MKYVQYDSLRGNQSMIRISKVNDTPILQTQQSIFSMICAKTLALLSVEYELGHSEIAFCFLKHVFLIRQTKPESALILILSVVGVPSSG